nr:transposase [Leptospira noguchii]
MQSRASYPTELKEKDWNKISNLFPREKALGRQKKYEDREIMNALFYISRSGCSWNMLPHDFPPSKTVYHIFNEWSKAGVFEKINDALRVNLRQLAGKEPDSSVGIIDSQSVKTIDIKDTTEEKK